MTLEQLIEACGDRFCSLLIRTYHGDMYWNANGKSGEEAKDLCFFYGSTPTEAVQKLYDHLKENNLL